MPWGLKRFQQSRQTHFVTFRELAQLFRLAKEADESVRSAFEKDLKKLRGAAEQ